MIAPDIPRSPDPNGFGKWSPQVWCQSDLNDLNPNMATDQTCLPPNLDSLRCAESPTNLRARTPRA